MPRHYSGVLGASSYDGQIEGLAPCCFHVLIRAGYVDGPAFVASSRTCGNIQRLCMQKLPSPCGTYSPTGRIASPIDFTAQHRQVEKHH